MNKQELKERWISILRHKARYEHDERKSGKIVASPSIDDICNEIEAFFTGLNMVEDRQRIIAMVSSLDSNPK